MIAPTSENDPRLAVKPASGRMISLGIGGNRLSIATRSPAPTTPSDSMMAMAQSSIPMGPEPTGAASYDSAPLSEDHRAVVVVVARELDEHGDMIARGVALALLALDPGIHHPVAERRSAEDEVDAHALIAREPQLLVVPERVALGLDGSHDVGEPDRLEVGEGGALARRD